MAKRYLNWALLLSLAIHQEASMSKMQPPVLSAKAVSPRLAIAFNEATAKALGGTAVSSIDNSPKTTQALFFAQVGTSDQSNAGGILPNNPAVTITARIRPAAEQVGQNAERVFVARFNNDWYMKTPQGWQAWNQQLSTLVAVDTQALSAIDDSTIQTQLSLLGNFSIYVGYRLNGIVYYSPNPLTFSLAPAKTELNISEFTPSSSTANAGDLLTLAVMVSNTGNTPATGVLRYYQSSDAQITLDDNEVCTNSIATLPATLSAEYRCQTPAPPPTTYYYGVCLDSNVNHFSTANKQCSNIVPVKVSAAQAGRAIPEQPITLKPSNSENRCTSPQMIVAGQCLMPTNLAKATYKLNDTGINACANDEFNGLTCPIAGYFTQDAETGRDQRFADASDGHAGFSFTKISSSGAVLSASATQWSCVKTL